MLYKYIVVDMDDTLLDSNKQIGSVSKHELQRLKKAGCKIILASGRHFRELSLYINELSLSNEDIVICSDGQYICNCLGEVIKEGCFLSLEDARQILSLVGQSRMSCFTEVMDFYIEANFIRRVRRKIYAHIHHKKILQVSRIDKFQDVLERIEKIVIPSEKLTMEQIEKIKEKYTVHLLLSNDLEILHKEVNKYSALVMLNSMGMIDIGQILYFGDGANDLECFINIKSCIAMGNAIEELKKKALFVTKTCNEDGVGYVLKNVNIK